MRFIAKRGLSIPSICSGFAAPIAIKTKQMIWKWEWSLAHFCRKPEIWEKFWQMGNAWSVRCRTSWRRQALKPHQSSTSKPWDDINLSELTVVENMDKSTPVSRPWSSEPALQWVLCLVSWHLSSLWPWVTNCVTAKDTLLCIYVTFCSPTIALHLPHHARFLGSLFFWVADFFVLYY